MRSRAVDFNHAHYVIEGLRFRTIAEVTRAARDFGYNGDENTMRGRLHGNGPLTWAHIGRPVDAAISADRLEYHRKSFNEAAVAAAAVDARKAAIAAAQQSEEE